MCCGNNGSCDVDGNGFGRGKLWAAMLAELVATDKVDKRRCHKTAVRERAWANNTMAKCCGESTKCTAVLAKSVLATKRSCQESADPAAVSAEMTLADEHCCQEAAECGARLGEIAHKAQAPPMTTSPHSAAMLSTPSHPMTYVGTVLSTMRGSTHATPPALALLALPLPALNCQL